MKSKAIMTLKKYPNCYVINGVPHFVNKEKQKYVDYNIHEVFRNHHTIDIYDKKYNYGELVASFFCGYFPEAKVHYYGAKTKAYNRYSYEFVPTDLMMDKNEHSIICNNMEFMRYDKYCGFNRLFYVSKEGVCIKYTHYHSICKVLRRGYDNPFQFPCVFFMINSYEHLQGVIYQLYKPEKYDSNKVRVFKDKCHGNCYLDNIEQITLKEYLFDYLNKEELQYMLHQVYDRENSGYFQTTKRNDLHDRIYKIIKKK